MSSRILFLSVATVALLASGAAFAGSNDVFTNQTDSSNQITVDQTQGTSDSVGYSDAAAVSQSGNNR